MAGSVIDEETGEPLIGGQVVIETTSLGTITSDDGSFLIKGVPPGTYRVSTSYLGYRPASRSVKLNSGDTVRLEFQLSSQVIDSPVIEVEYSRERIPRIPETKLSRIDLGAGLPTARELRCDGEKRFHGVFIRDGKWADFRSVAEMKCDLPGRGPRPRRIIDREEASLLTEEQKAEFARRGYWVRGFNDEEYLR
ncbi:MAG: carboxypeptidase-like regulatory domain-containing protein [Gemmatimonadota bacterium]|nr:carboxypeptidase-like regulatory domain-containing protein [Gemmatimonadota bacterium]